MQKSEKTYRIVGIQQDLGCGRADVVDQQITYLVPVEDLVSCNKGVRMRELNFKLIHSHGERCDILIVRFAVSHIVIRSFTFIHPRTFKVSFIRTKSHFLRTRTLEVLPCDFAFVFRYIRKTINFISDFAIQNLSAS